jgi:hypothetical protein
MRMLAEEGVMGLNHTVAGIREAEVKSQNRSPQLEVCAPENELENRIRNLERLANSLHAALGRESFSGKPHALDLLNDLRLRIKASWNMFRVARLLSEPARASMLAKVRDSVRALEGIVASRFGVEMT